MKIGIVSLPAVFEKSKRGRAFTQKLNEAGRSWQTKMQTVEEKRKKLQISLTAAGENANPDQVLEFRGLEMELSYLRQRSEAELKALAQTMQAKVMDELAPMLAEFAKKQGLSLVLTVPSANVLYAEPTIDITEGLIAFYDSRVKA